MKVDTTKELGRGGFGVVYKAKYRGRDAAVKELLVKDLSPHAQEEFQSEAKIMLQLRDPGVVHLYGVTQDKPHQMVMEFCALGSLDKYLQRRKLEEVSWDVRFHLATGIASGLYYLHSYNPIIIHGDLKSLNVLLTGDPLRPDTKLADFGLSKLKTETQSKTKVSTADKGLSIQWAAPELFSLTPKKTPASDMYAFGITLWEIASHDYPYRNVTIDMIQVLIKSGERAEVPVNTPPLFAKVMTDCWSQKASDRSSAKVALEKLQTYEETAEAKFRLGQYYRDILGDYEQAIKCFQLAADRGAATAHFCLGLCYRDGQGVSPDHKQAVKHFQLAADQGVAEAQFCIGLCYRDGQGVDPDYKQAMRYFQLAADQGNSDAQSVLTGKEIVDSKRIDTSLKDTPLVERGVLQSSSSHSGNSPIMSRLFNSGNASTSVLSAGLLNSSSSSSSSPIVSQFLDSSRSGVNSRGAFFSGSSGSTTVSSTTATTMNVNSSPFNSSASASSSADNVVGSQLLRSSTTPSSVVTSGVHSAPLKSTSGRSPSLSSANSFSEMFHSPPSSLSVKSNQAILTYSQQVEAASKAIQSKINTNEFLTLLKWVKEGHLLEVERLLKKSPTLALGTGTVTDRSDRTFKNVTALQYAAWALDVEMVEFIMKYAGGHHSAIQLKALAEEPQVYSVHGASYDVTPLVTKYQTYL